MQSLRNPVSRIKSAITTWVHTHSSQSPSSQSHVTPIDHSDAIDILSCTRRRWVIEFLAGQRSDEKITISHLSEQIAAMENDCTVKELSSKQRERVYVSLYQTHLPKVDSIIDYNRDRGTITPTEAPAHLWNAYKDFCNRLDG